jgi:hypothetical protein
MKQNETIKTPKTAILRECKLCDFETCKKTDWDRHILTVKHKLKQNETIETHIAQKNSQQCACCGILLNSRTTMWRHSKKCKKPEDPEKSEENEDKINNYMQQQVTPDMSNNVMLELLKQNQEFKELIIEQNKQLMDLAGKIGNNNTNNSNNKTFNLNFFLNEQCKDALNITDFANQIKLQLSDLDMIGRIGYTEGMSKIIVRNLKDMDVFKRPIHCSDLKREVMYVKDKDAWEKEGGENIKIKKAIKVIEHKNIKQIPQWKEENPASEDYDSKKHMDYHNIIIESMGGPTNEDENKKREKIIRNIAKEVTIDRK